MVLDFGLLSSGLFPNSDANGEGLGGDEDTQIQGGTEKFWSCSGYHFHGVTDEQDVDWFASFPILDSNVSIEADGNVLVCDVQLPHGATITKIVVFSSQSTQGYVMLRWELEGGGSGGTIGSGTLNTEDTTLTNTIVDNQNYRYFMVALGSGALTNDEIYGARITYTT